MKTRLLKPLGIFAGTYAVMKLLQPWFNTWGSTQSERSLSFSYEEKMGSRRVTTHAVTVRAPTFVVWPWLVQMGAGRGGFYSYSWLENLFGAHLRNAESILPELQLLKEGDSIYLHPKAPPLRVRLYERNHILALDGWIFYLSPLSLGRTRLISCTYELPYRRSDPLEKRILERFLKSVFFDFIHFVMGRKQLLEIKRLSEKSAIARPTPDVPLYPDITDLSCQSE